MLNKSEGSMSIKCYNINLYERILYSSFVRFYSNRYLKGHIKKDVMMSIIGQTRTVSNGITYNHDKYIEVLVNVVPSNHKIDRLAMYENILTLTHELYHTYIYLIADRYDNRWALYNNYIHILEPRRIQTMLTDKEREEMVTNKKLLVSTYEKVNLKLIIGSYIITYINPEKMLELAKQKYG